MIVWISSVADYLKQNDRDEFSVSFNEGRMLFSSYTHLTVQNPFLGVHRKKS